jgi:PEP-CTERM motif
MKLRFCILTATTLGISLLNSGSAGAALIGNDYSGNLYDVNTATGAATNARSTGISNLAGIAFSPGGILYGLGISTAGTNVSLYTINPTTGSSTLVGTSAPANFNDAYGEGDIHFNPVTGTLYGIEYSRFQNGGSPPVIQQLFTISTANGATSNFNNLPFFNNSGVVDYSGLTFDSTGKMYLLDTASIDPFGHLETGSASPFSISTDVKLSAALGSFAGMDFNPANGSLYVADGGVSGGSLYRLNAATGGLTLVGSTGLAQGLAGLAFTPTPEPGTIALLGMGFVFLALGRRIRRH